MPVSRVGALGFYDTRTVTAFGFVDETYLDTATYVSVSGVSATVTIGTAAGTTDSPLLPSVSATITLGTITATGGATLVPITGLIATTAIGRTQLGLVSIPTCYSISWQHLNNSRWNIQARPT